MPDVNTPGSQMTDLSSQAAVVAAGQKAGIVGRIATAARYVISGVSPSSWFGPNQPLQVMAPPDVKGRRYDYPVGTNINGTPRGDQSASFHDLRTLSEVCDILRAAIEARKEQMAAMDWIIRPRAEKLGISGGPKQRMYYNPASAQAQGIQIPKEVQDRIDAATDFFQFPDREQSWDQWQRALIEELLVTDAVSVYRRRTRGGMLYSLDLIDGALIKPLLDFDGRAPDAPNPAYQQWLHGIPAADFTRDELMYLPRNVRTNKMYGYSPVEQVVVTVNTAVRRSLSQLDYYLEGSQPDAFVGLPQGWSMDQIKDFQTYFDALLSGKLGQRRKVRFMPGEFKYQETKAPPLKDIYDEWLARVICFVLMVAADPFVTQVNRSSSEVSRARALEEGKAPLQRFIKHNVVDRVLREDMGCGDLEFLYLEDVEQDGKTQMEIDTGYTAAGIFTLDEVRTNRGRQAFGGAASTPMIKTTSGYIPIGALVGLNAADALQASGAIRGGGPGTHGVLAQSPENEPDTPAVPTTTGSPSNQPNNSF